MHKFHFILYDRPREGLIRIYTTVGHYTGHPKSARIAPETEVGTGQFWGGHWPLANVMAHPVGSTNVYKKKFFYTESQANKNGLCISFGAICHDCLAGTLELNAFSTPKQLCCPFVRGLTPNYWTRRLPSAFASPELIGKSPSKLT